MNTISKTVGLIALVALLSGVPVPVAAESTETLSKRERVQQVRDALRERRQELRLQGQEQATTLEAEAQQVADEQEPTLLSLITTRYQETLAHLQNIQVRLQVYVQANLNEEDQRLAGEVLENAAATLKEAGTRIETMQSIAQQDVGLTSTPSTELIELYEREAYVAKQLLKEANTSLVHVVQLIQALNTE